jgi:acyl carrier protein
MLRLIVIAGAVLAFLTPQARAADCAAAVRALIVEHLGVEREKVVGKASIVDDLGADKFDAVEIVMVAEEKFGFKIPDRDAQSIITVDDLVCLANRKAKAGCR